MKQENINARSAALQILMSVETKNAYSNLELRNIHAAHMLSKPEDRRLLSMLVYGVIRMRRTIDHIISMYSEIPAAKLSTTIINILRLGVYQLKYMDRIPVSAICNESVELAKNSGSKKASGFVNAVLRNMVRNPGKMNPVVPATFAEADITAIGTALSYPDWLVQKWIYDYGSERAVSIMKASNTPALLTIRVNTLKKSKNEIVEILKQEGVEVRNGNHSVNSLVIENTGGIERLDAFKQGLFYVQDEASMLAVECLSPKPGDTVIDLCSAPGGKSTYIAELMSNKGVIYSGDLHAGRLKLVNESAFRLGIDIIKTTVWDAKILKTEYVSSADKVLVDAPCSGLGVIRRKPEIKWTSSAGSVSSLAEVQKEILNTAAAYVKPMGILMYCTCTLMKEENDEVIEDFLKQNSCFRLMLKKTLFTYIDGTDGFFFAKLIREIT